MNHKNFRVTRITFVIASAFIVAAGADTQIKKAMADPWNTAPQKMTIGASPKLPNVNEVIRRDPFSGAPVDKNAPQGPSNTPPVINITGPVPNPGQINISPPQSGPGAPVFGPNTRPDPNVGTVVPNAGSLQAEISVIATMTGSGKPLALIANGMATDIVGVGDSLGTRKIRRIVSQGIEFEDGTRLGVVHRPTSTSVLPNTQNFQPPTSIDQNTNVNQYNPAVINGQPNPVQISPSQSTIPQTNSGSDSKNGVTNYNFGPLPTPLPGQTPASIPRLFTPPPSPPSH